MSRLPALFISHGAPDLALRAGAVQAFLQQLPQQLPRPQAILAVSAHWPSLTPRVGAALAPATLHDFAGFPAELYRLNYPALGAPALAQQAVSLLVEAGFAATTDISRSLDHGIWTPLLLAYPAADIPVVPVSIQFNQGPVHHWQVGQALAPLRDQGVLLLASGSATHNLRAFDSQYDGPIPAWAEAFDQWLAAAIARADHAALLNYRQLAPHAAANHPTEEHLLPLFVALGAGSGSPGRQLHSSFTYGAFSMAAYAFD